MVYSKNHIRFLLTLFSIRELAAELTRLGHRVVPWPTVQVWSRGAKPRYKYRKLLMRLYQKCRDDIGSIEKEFKPKTGPGRPFKHETINLF
jgi:hypothetical protein